MGGGDGGARAGSLAQDGHGAHNAGRADADMGAADVASSEHQVVHIDGVQTAVGDAVGLRQAALLEVPAVLGVHKEASGEVVVDLPAAVGYGVVKGRRVLHIPLAEDVVPHVAAALPLAGQKANPLQFPVLRAVVAPVLDVVPYAEGDLQQLVPDGFGVCDAVLQAPQLNPIEVGVDGVQVVGLVVHLLVRLEAVGPGGRRVGYRMIGFPGLDQQAHAHGVLVGLLQAEFLAEFLPALAAHPEFCAAQRGQDAVPGAVDEDVGRHRMPGVGGQLEAGHGPDAAAVHLRLAAGAVEQQVDIGLEADLLIENAVPHGVVPFGVAVHIFQQQLLQQPRLLQVPHPRPRAGDPHADLRTGIAAQYGTVVHQDHLCAAAGRRNRREHTADAAADDADLRLVWDLAQFHPCCLLSQLKETVSIFPNN